MTNKIDQEISSKLDQVLNPKTGKSLLEEGRFREAIVKDDVLYLKYDRSEITVEEKIEIQKQIHQAFEGQFDQAKIKILTTSEGSTQVKTSQQQPAAQLKAGHGQNTGKRKVSGVKHVIAVSSGKGGVGKSTVSVNLAFALRNLGKRVSLLDADVYGPSLPMLLGRRKEKPGANADKKILPVEAHGVSFMSFGLFIEEKDPVIWRGPMLGGVLNQFLFDVNWDSDYLIIDLPPGTGDMQLSLVQNTQLDGVVVVSTPQDVALLDSIKGLNMFKQLKIPVLGFVENMSYFICDSCEKHHYIFGDGGVEKACQELEVPFLGKIPLSSELRVASDEGMPFLAKKDNLNHPITKAYSEIAEALNKTLVGGQDKGFFKNLFN